MLTLEVLILMDLQCEKLRNTTLLKKAEAIQTSAIDKVDVWEYSFDR
jgi:hypothetical protein